MSASVFVISSLGFVQIYPYLASTLYCLLPGASAMINIFSWGLLTVYIFLHPHVRRLQGGKLKEAIILLP